MKKFIGILILLFIITVLTFTLLTKGRTASQSSKISQQQSSNAITIKNYNFYPMQFTVKKGTKVTWTNEDMARHNIVFDSGSPVENIPLLIGKGEQYSYTFTKAGTYQYHCDPHPYMKARIEVTP